MSQLVAALPLFVILVASLSFHEAAHAWTADRLGDPTARMLGRLTLNPLAHIDWIGTVLFPLISILSGLALLGWAKPVPVNMRNLKSPRRDFAVVALAGPVSNLVLATLASLLHALVAGSSHSDGSSVGLVSNVLEGFVQVNVLLAVFNLIPVPPLDGGNVAMGLLPASAAMLVARIRPYGFIVLYALMFSGILWDLIEPVTNTILAWLP